MSRDILSCNKKVVSNLRRTIGQLLALNPNIAPILMRMGMHCLGCPASRGESIEAACSAHGTDADALVEAINKFLAEKK